MSVLSLLLKDRVQKSHGSVLCWTSRSFAHNSTHSCVHVVYTRIMFLLMIPRDIAETFLFFISKKCDKQTRSPLRYRRPLIYLSSLLSAFQSPLRQRADREREGGRDPRGSVSAARQGRMRRKTHRSVAPVAFSSMTSQYLSPIILPLSIMPAVTRQ